MMRSSSSSSITPQRTNHHHRHHQRTSTSSNGGRDGEADDGHRAGVSALEMNEIDLERLRLVFGSASSGDLSHRKPHELRELWLQKTAEAAAITTPSTATPSQKPTKAKMPCFLLDPSEEDHIPPHAVALQLLLGRRRSSFSPNGDSLYKPVASCSSGDDDGGSRDDEPRRSGYGKNKKTHPSTLRGSFMVWPLILVAFVMMACQFVLEVLGGAGAIWGTAELFTLRKGGAEHPSWRLFTLWASIVGICCLVRFFLVHPFFVSATAPTFAEKHNLRGLLRRYNKAGYCHRIGLFFELVTLVAKDPVLFLHPTKGLALSSCCGCYCVCCGSRWSSFDGDVGINDNDNDDIESGLDYGSCSRSSVSSSGSLEKPSAQRSTWDMSDDDDDGHDENADEFGTAAGP